MTEATNSITISQIKNEARGVLFNALLSDLADYHRVLVSPLSDYAYAQSPADARTVAISARRSIYNEHLASYRSLFGKLPEGMALITDPVTYNR